MIRTKIVCTIGPASRDPAILRQIIEAGMDVARLNMSHASHEYHAETIAIIRATCKEVGTQVAIMADLQGPKLRIGDMDDEGVQVSEGENVVLTTRKMTGRRKKTGRLSATIPIQYRELPQDIHPGERILIDDGLIEMKVLGISGPDIFCSVITGGLLTDNKGLNLPGAMLSSLPSITDKDWADLDFALDQELDWVALSFVRSAHDVLLLKDRMGNTRGKNGPLPVIAKIEKPQALECLHEIIEVADAIMIARGDLGIEIPPERVPLVQKRMIKLCNAAGKPVITATQMLDSMIRSPRPTRAEASDVANAILDGTDALMLSGETASGKYPLESVKTMTRIAAEVEAGMLAGRWKVPGHIEHDRGDVTDAVSHATCETASDLNAAAIITATATGRTARNVARYRPHALIVAVTPNRVVERQLKLTWGVVPLNSRGAKSTDQVIRDSVALTVRHGLARVKDRVVITAGLATNVAGMTNMMMVQEIQEEPERSR